VTVPIARPLFDAAPLRGSDWALIAGFALAPVRVVELWKIVRK